MVCKTQSSGLITRSISVAYVLLCDNVKFKSLEDRNLSGLVSCKNSSDFFMTPLGEFRSFSNRFL